MVRTTAEEGEQAVLVVRAFGGLDLGAEGALAAQRVAEPGRLLPGPGHLVGRQPHRPGYVHVVVLPARADARGIVAPDAGLQHFRLDRYPPSPAVGRLVDRYWVVTWDLRGRPRTPSTCSPIPS